MYVLPEVHAVNGPDTWTVEKVADRTWHVKDRHGATMDTYTTKRAAQADIEPGGLLHARYDEKGAWFAGKTPHGQRTWEECEPEVRDIFTVVDGRAVTWRDAAEADPRLAALLDVCTDILVAGVEGGVNYWAAVSKYKWGDAELEGGSLAVPKGRKRDATAILHNAEDGERVGKITPQGVLTAVRAIAGDNTWSGYGWDGKLRTRCVMLLDDPREDDFDAADADCIIQRALLGELVYG